MTHINRFGPFAAVARIAAFAAVVVGMLVAVSGTAHALSTMNEGFERPHANLSFRTFGTAGGGLVVNNTPFMPNRSRSGVGHALLWARNRGSWSFVDRAFTKRREDVNCYASVYINPQGGAEEVSLDVDGGRGTPPGGLTAGPMTGSGYQLVKTPWFYSEDTMLVARVAVTSASTSTQAIRVDDLKVVCEVLF
jgi:hypothetical protein